MTTKHKHYEVIVAWAEGKKIQYKDPVMSTWKNFPENLSPLWYEEGEYRIKPEPKKIKFRTYLWRSGGGVYSVHVLHGIWDNKDLPQGFVKWIGEDWQEVEIPEE